MGGFAFKMAFMTVQLSFRGGQNLTLPKYTHGLPRMVTQERAKRNRFQLKGLKEWTL